MISFALSADNIGKRYRSGSIFADITLAVRNGSTTAVTGHNGSGKTTLMKILAGLLSPSSGTVQYMVAGKTVEKERWHEHIGYVAPYLALYEEFSAWEHLRLNASLRGMSFDAALAEQLLKRMGIFHRRFDAIRAYSSGMKQRIKYAVALLNRPTLLFLDEPMTNLDEAGFDVVVSLLQEHSTAGGAVLIATNDSRDIDLCDSSVSVAPGSTQ